jgi:pilus assembly protein Flp/PilA
VQSSEGFGPPFAVALSRRQISSLVSSGVFILSRFGLSRIDGAGEAAGGFNIEPRRGRASSAERNHLGALGNFRFALQPSRRKTSMKQLLKNLLNDESGQDLIEYALIAALIALVAITGLNGLAGKINSEFTAIGGDL